MAFFDRFIWIFSAPTKVFDDIKESRVGWWQPWIWMSVISMAVTYFSLPIQRFVAELNPADLPAEQLQQQLDWMDKFGTIQLIALPVVILLLVLIVGGLSYILVSILAEKAAFKKYLTLYFYAGIISSLTGVLSTIMVRIKGVETIRVPADAQFSVGLGFLAPAGATVVKALLSGIEFFVIWSLVVVAMGLMRVFDMPRRHAIYCIVPLWLIDVLLILINDLASGVK